MDAGSDAPILIRPIRLGKTVSRWGALGFAFAAISSLTSSPAFANHHGSSGVPSWYITLHSPHLTRAQALALSAPVTGTASSTAPSAGAPDPASTTAFLARLQAQYTANPAAFAAVAPKYAALFAQQARLAAGDYTNVSGLLPTSPAWNYLRFRRSLDPARFDHYHPQIGPLLDVDQQVRHQLDNPPQPQVLNPPPSDTGNSGGGGTPPTNPPSTPPLPPSVPEPASVVLFLTGLTVITWFVVSHERQRQMALRERLESQNDVENVGRAIVDGSVSLIAIDQDSKSLAKRSATTTTGAQVVNAGCA